MPVLMTHDPGKRNMLSHSQLEKISLSNLSYNIFTLYYRSLYFYMGMSRPSMTWSLTMALITLPRLLFKENQSLASGLYLSHCLGRILSYYSDLSFDVNSSRKACPDSQVSGNQNILVSSHLISILCVTCLTPNIFLLLMISSQNVSLL